ncbi:MAG: molybdopterin molybdotransferase MoeA, partial [Chloroflexota bacterium]
MRTTTIEFFNVQPVVQALETLFNHIAPTTQTETIPVMQSRGRIVAVPPESPVNLPEFVRSTMDGYAVRAEDTFGASQSLPAYLEIAAPVKMGEQPIHTLQTGQASSIHTGGMLPDGANAVVMIERTQKVDDSEIEVLAPVAPGENMVQVGEDVAQGGEILPAGQRIRPQDIGGMLAVGVLEVEVIRQPVVAIMGSGDEIVHPGETPAYGQIRDINSYTLAALFEEAGAQVNILGTAADTYDDIARMVREGLADADMLVISAGSSVSTRDFTNEAIQAAGNPGVLQHGLAVKPGKPAILASCDGKPVIGLPGNPVSAMLIARQIVIPTLQHLTGENVRRSGTIQAILGSNIASTTGREDTIPVRLIERDGETVADPIFGKSNLIFTLINADGLVHVPLNSNGLKAGEVV